MSLGDVGRLQHNAILYDMYDVPRGLFVVVSLGTSINLHKSIQITRNLQQFLKSLMEALGTPINLCPASI